MANSKDLNLTAVGLNIDVIADPGGGKSHFARSAAEWAARNGKKAVGLISPRAEVLSYAGVDMDYPDDYSDPEWNPSAKSFKTMMEVVAERELAKGEARPALGVVFFDTFKAGPSEGIWRKIVAECGTDDFTTMGGNARQPYVTYASRMTRLMDRLDLLRWRKNVHVIKLWHQDIREYEGAGQARKEQEKVGQGFKTVVHWDLAKLPELRGQIMRQSILKWSDIAFYGEPVVGSNPFLCKLILLPGGTRMAKSRLPIIKALQNPSATFGSGAQDVPNDFGKLMGVVQAL